MNHLLRYSGAGLLVVSLVFLGCEHREWKEYGRDGSRRANQEDEDVLNVNTAKTLNFTSTGWVFQSPGGSFVASPTVYDETVYVGDGVTGIFYAVHARGPNQGKVRWQYPPTTAPSPPDACGTTTAPLVISPIVGSGNPSGPGIASSAAITDDVPGHRAAVIFGAPDPNSNNGDGRLWALDAHTGECIWKSVVIAPTSGTAKIGYSSPAIAHHRAYVGAAARTPDAPITIGQIYAIHLSDGSRDSSFSFSSSGPPAGGGIWSSPAVTPSGNLIVTTGNSCFHSFPDCTGSVPSPDYNMSMVKLDWHNGNVLWQLQPVDINYDDDPDYAATPLVAKTHCGVMAIGVQKDGYLHAVNVRHGGFHTNAACSYTGHSLECPRWTFPPVPSLPFQTDGHGDTRFIRPGALAGNHLYITSGGYNLNEIAPVDIYGNAPGRILLNRLYSLNVCSADDDRVRWVFDLNGFGAGAPSVAHGLIYVGADTEFDTSSNPHELYVLADPEVLPAAGTACSYPLGPASSGFPPGPACTGAGFKIVNVPQTVVHFPLKGAMPAHPAIAEGRVFVATTGGYLYGLAP